MNDFDEYDYDDYDEGDSIECADCEEWFPPDEIKLCKCGADVCDECRVDHKHDLEAE